MLIVSTKEDVTTVGDVEGVDGIFDVDQATGEHLLQFTGWRHPTEDEAEGFTPPDVKKVGRSRKT
jgi:hypothetical protein